MKPTGAKVDQFLVSATVDGRDMGIWDTKEGGETDSEETRYRPGGGPEESLGGSTTVTQVTATRMFRRGRDDTALRYLRSKAGHGEVILKVITKDADGNPWADGETYRGVLKRVSPPTVDSNSNDVAMVTMEMTPGSTVS